MSYNFKIHKTAQIQNEPPKGSPPSYWVKMKGELLKITNLKPEIKTILNSADKIVFDAQKPSDKPEAIAYVSSADKNNNGKIDKIHFVLPNMPQNVSEDQFSQVLEQIAHVLMHEEAHIEDFNPSTGDFPGGEGKAESVEKAFIPQLPEDVKLAYYRGLLGKMASEFSAEKNGKVRR